MVPVSVCTRWQLLPSLHQQHTGVAYLPGSFLGNSEAFLKLGLVLFAVGETGRGRLGATDTATQIGSVDFWFVEAKHGDLRGNTGCTMQDLVNKETSVTELV